MATKKLAFGGMSKAIRPALNKAAAQIAAKPTAQAPGRGLQGLGAAAAEALKKVKQGTPQSSTMGAKLAGMANKAGLGAGPTVPANMAKISQLTGMLQGKPMTNAMMKKGGMAKGYAAGGMAMVDKEKNPGLAKLPTEVRNKMGYMKKGGMAECKTVAKKEVKSHEKRMHGMAKGGSIDGCAIRGKTKTSMVKMKRGGSC
jgi:hypothetical protein